MVSSFFLFSRAEQARASGLKVEHRSRESPCSTLFVLFCRGLQEGSFDCPPRVPVRNPNLVLDSRGATQRGTAFDCYVRLIRANPPVTRRSFYSGVLCRRVVPTALPGCP